MKRKFFQMDKVLCADPNEGANPCTETLQIG